MKHKAKSAKDKLARTADAMLTDANDSPADALDKFVIAIRDKPTLIRALALLYLQTRHSETYAQGDRSNTDEAAGPQTTLDTYKVRDGRAIGKVRVNEIPSLRQQALREAYVLDQVLRRHCKARGLDSVAEFGVVDLSKYTVPAKKGCASPD
jgi:hypothetical protein